MGFSKEVCYYLPPRQLSDLANYALFSDFRIRTYVIGRTNHLTLVLVKEICPGQRGRIHKVLPALAVLWLAVASIKIEAFLVVFALFYFYSQVQTKNA